MKEDQFLSALSKKKGYRIGAWICLVIIAALIVATLITGIMGSPYFLGCLFLCIIVPIFMYVALWLGKVLSSLNNRDKKREADADMQDK